MVKTLKGNKDWERSYGIIGSSDSENSIFYGTEVCLCVFIASAL